MTEEALQYHVTQEHDDTIEYLDKDLVTYFNDQGNELREIMDSIREDIYSIQALENFADSIANKEILVHSDIISYNNLIERKHLNTNKGTNYNQVSLESFETLVETSSTVYDTATNISGKALSAAFIIKDGVINGAAMAKILYEKVQNSIVKIASSWDFVCSMIEKRWLGLAQLVQVYDLQHQKLKEKFEAIELNNDALAFFTVNLYVAKLRADGRDIKKKETLIDSLIIDSKGILEIGSTFIEQMQQVKKIDAYSSQALSLRYPYKKALALNANCINNLLKELANNNLFSNGGVVKNYQAQSRVLLGGKVMTINYNEEPVKEESVRKDLKSFIGNLNFISIKRKDGSTNDTENVEVEALTFEEAKTIFNSVAQTNEALRLYQESKVPSILSSRTSITALIKFGGGLTGGAAAFDTIKSFFNREDNLKAFNLVAPVAVSKLLGTFLAASTFAVFSSIVAASAAAFIVDYLRKYIISNLFSMMDLQYKVTDIIEKFDHDYVDTLIEIHNQGYRVCKKLASSRNWEY